MKKLLLFCTLFILISNSLRADEGMWLLPFLEKMNIKDMKAKGLKLSVKDIYSVNDLALKDAIVIFGGGCTGEVVSPNGLLLTNHHCGYDAIQSHSSVENDYLKNGFWAMSYAEEIPTPGLKATFIRSISDVSDQILPNLTPAMTEAQRTEKINACIAEIKTGVTLKNEFQAIEIYDFFGGNQYLMFVTEVFNDVRMVGAPPSSIGKFGGETDNWMWPRHTGDFSVFRIYASPDNQPAAYAKANQPYQAPKHLTISLQGYKPGDYTMIMGFPGSTKRYMSSYEIDQTLSVDNPTRIFIRGERQRLMMEEMKKSDKIRIQYASKYAGSSNYWKNSIGMSRGLEKLHVKEQKQAQEERFRAWVGEDPTRIGKYGEALALKEKAVRERTPLMRSLQYLSEAMLRGIELVEMTETIAGHLVKENQLSEEGLKQIRTYTKELYKDFDKDTDRKIAKRMLEIVRDSLPATELPAFYQVIEKQFNGDIGRYVDDLYARSLFASEQQLELFLQNPSLETLTQDPAYGVAKAFRETYMPLVERILQMQNDFKRGHRLFIAGLREMESDKKLYPDANFTLRLTYGQVLPYRPADGVIYDYYTTLSGVMAKEDATNPMEFAVPAKLKELYKAKDFGPYAVNGDVPVAFLSNNDITGGNSGSPVLNKHGQLIGLAFDGNWEAMSGDIAFEPELQRTINVDIRYVLFVMDKFAGAQRLIDEMTIVR